MKLLLTVYPNLLDCITKEGVSLLTHELFTTWPITRRQILDSSKLKEFADDNFKFDENGRKLTKQVENIVGKGEIARYEQFLLFPQCFQKACFPGALRQKMSLCGNGIIQSFDNPDRKGFWKHRGKRLKFW